LTSRNTKFVVQCLRCGKTFAEGFVPRCTSCNGATDITYLQPQRIRDGESNPVRRYFDFMPVLDIDKAIWLGAPEPTPCIHAKNLGDVIGHPKVYLKDETKHPTRTTKDRMASGVLSYFREIGLWEFVSSSTGNSSTSFAVGAGANPEFTIHLYCGESFLYAMNWPDYPNVELYVLKGATFVEAFDFSRQAGPAAGRIMERGFFNPARRAALKLAFFEAAEQIPEPIDWYFQATSSGMGVFGTWVGAKELLKAGVIDRPPRLACIQQETCAPQVNAWKDGSKEILPNHLVPQPTGPARAIMRGDPTHVYPYMQALVRESGGTFESVSERQILDAQRLIQEAEGIPACAASACTLAGLRKLLEQGTVSKDETVMLNITGADREFRHPKHYTILERKDGGWVESQSV